MRCFKEERSSQAIEIQLVNKSNYALWLSKTTSILNTWLTTTSFRAEVGHYAVIPAANGTIGRIVVIVDEHDPLWAIAHLPYQLPEGDYYISSEWTGSSYYLALGFGLGSYQFDRYKQSKRSPAILCIDAALLKQMEILIPSLYSVRSWISTPADDLGPSEFSAEIEHIAKTYGATYQVIADQELIRENYPCIYTVGRASDDPPCLVDFRYGKKEHPKVTLVGKGVCFDTGGLDIKPTSYMRLMKKDMGGAAHVMGLAMMIMQAKLPIQLRVLIPLAENAVSGNAYRPGDVIKSRKGLTIEVGNTDAEGRLVLADALTEAVSEHPDLVIDLATLTGAARIALGTELPALFSNNDTVLNALVACGKEEHDPLWPMPLFAPYRDHIMSSIADLTNDPSESYGGAITAALFLKEFVPDNISWVHIDLMAWNTKAKPGRPVGGEAMGIRAIFAYLCKQYSA